MIDVLKDLWGFMKARKKFWLAPIIVIPALAGKFDRIITRFCGGVIYIHAVLTSRHANNTYDGFNFHRKESTISTFAACEQ
jgi:hypothetical protein